MGPCDPVCPNNGHLLTVSPPTSQSICSRCDAFALCRIVLCRKCGHIFPPLALQHDNLDLEVRSGFCCCAKRAAHVDPALQSTCFARRLTFGPVNYYTVWSTLPFEMVYYLLTLSGLECIAYSTEALCFARTVTSSHHRPEQTLRAP